MFSLITMILTIQFVSSQLLVSNLVNNGSVKTSCTPHRCVIVVEKENQISLAWAAVTIALFSIMLLLLLLFSLLYLIAYLLIRAQAKKQIVTTTGIYPGVLQHGLVQKFLGSEVLHDKSIEEHEVITTGERKISVTCPETCMGASRRRHHNILSSFFWLYVALSGATMSRADFILSESKAVVNTPLEKQTVLLRLEMALPEDVDILTECLPVKQITAGFFEPGVQSCQLSNTLAALVMPCVQGQPFCMCIDIINKKVSAKTLCPYQWIYIQPALIKCANSIQSACPFENMTFVDKSNIESIPQDLIHRIKRDLVTEKEERFRLNRHKRYAVENDRFCSGGCDKTMCLYATACGWVGCEIGCMATTAAINILKDELRASVDVLLGLLEKHQFYIDVLFNVTGDLLLRVAIQEGLEESGMFEDLIGILRVSHLQYVDKQSLINLIRTKRQLDLQDHERLCFQQQFHSLPTLEVSKLWEEALKKDASLPPYQLSTKLGKWFCAYGRKELNFIWRGFVNVEIQTIYLAYKPPKFYKVDETHCASQVSVFAAYDAELTQRLTWSPEEIRCRSLDFNDYCSFLSYAQPVKAPESWSRINRSPEIYVAGSDATVISDTTCGDYSLISADQFLIISTQLDVLRDLENLGKGDVFLKKEQKSYTIKIGQSSLTVPANSIDTNLTVVVKAESSWNSIKISAGVVSTQNYDYFDPQLVQEASTLGVSKQITELKTYQEANSKGVQEARDDIKEIRSNSDKRLAALGDGVVYATGLGLGGVSGAGGCGCCALIGCCCSTFLCFKLIIFKDRFGAGKSFKFFIRRISRRDILTSTKPALFSNGVVLPSGEFRARFCMFMLYRIRWIRIQKLYLCGVLEHFTTYSGFIQNGAPEPSKACCPPVCCNREEEAQIKLIYKGTSNERFGGPRTETDEKTITSLVLGNVTCSVAFHGVPTLFFLNPFFDKKALSESILNYDHELGEIRLKNNSTFKIKKPVEKLSFTTAKKHLWTLSQDKVMLNDQVVDIPVLDFLATCTAEDMLNQSGENDYATLGEYSFKVDSKDTLEETLAVVYEQPVQGPSDQIVQETKLIIEELAVNQGLQSLV